MYTRGIQVLQSVTISERLGRATLDNHRIAYAASADKEDG